MLTAAARLILLSRTCWELAHEIPSDISTINNGVRMEPPDRTVVAVGTVNQESNFFK